MCKDKKYQEKEWLTFACQDASTFNFGFERISDGKLIGSGDIGLNEDYTCWGFGYNLRYDCWGMGYATEATKAMKKCGLHFAGYDEFQKLDSSCKMQSIKYEGTLSHYTFLYSYII